MSKIYEPKGKAREYSPFALNYFKGCDHGCFYCYVPRIMKTLNPDYVHSDVSCSLSGIQKECERFRKSKNGEKQILLSFTGDPYCGFETGQTREVLSALLDNQCHIAILTKNPMKALRDLDLISEFENIKVGTTLTCLDDSDSKKCEPGAPTGIERIEGLKLFSECGIKTWVSFEPVLYPEQTLKMIEIVSEFIDHIKIGKLNNHPREKEIDWKAFLMDAVKLSRNLGLKFYVKNDLARFGNELMFKYPEREQDYLNV